MTDTDDDATVLALLIETSAAHWKSVPTDTGEGATQLSFKSFIEQLLVFVNSFLLLNEDNKVVVFAMHDNSSPILYESPGLRDGGAGAAAGEGLEEVAAALAEGLRRLPPPPAEGPAQPAVSAALSRTLCYLRRRCPAGSAQRRARPRIFCLQGSPDVSAQYIAVMNCIFSAQKADIVMDACMLGSSDSAFLQQAAYLTKGVYLRPPRPAALIQYLLTVFAPDVHSRSLLQLPTLLGVDFRASCFCHKRPIDLGYVCSVCLSIFCEKAPECATCGSKFGAKRQTIAERDGGGR